ncbi:MAG: glycosyltransferase [Verrucomicrobia bacterium]|nr:glycosyltransferase [Verrucomicrobiota bacterium]
MKILYFHTGRVEARQANLTQTLQMVTAFTELGHAVTLALNTSRCTQAEGEQIVKEQLNLTELPFLIKIYKGRSLCGRFRSLGAADAALKLSQETRYDFIFVRNPLPLPLLKKAACPVIFEAHHTDCFDKLPFFDWWWRRRIVALACSDQMPVMIAISQALANWWTAAGVPSSKVLALHDAVNPTFIPAGLDQMSARKELELAAERPVVLYAGSLYADRGADTILRLADMRRDALFVVVGGPEETAKALAAKAEKTQIENIRFEGRVPHYRIAHYLAAADILLMVWSWKVKTIHYCSPLKLFEYMLAEREIVGQAFPTILEVIEDGVHARLADPDSFEDLVDKLSGALDHPNPELARAARVLVIREYTWQNRCRQIIEAFEGPL